MRSMLVALGAVVSLCGGLLPAASAVPLQRPDYVPVNGPIFATPQGNQISSRLEKLIDGAVEPAVIRAATGITDTDLAWKLVQAHRRGVAVRMVIPGNTSRGCSSQASQDLIEALGTDTSGGSWVACIQGSARNEPGSPGHMHMKVWGFTRTAGRSDVVVVTSLNATFNGAEVQHNDAYIAVGWTKLHTAWRTLFGELKADAGGGFWKRNWTRGTAYATPVAESEDPVLKRIRGIPADGARIRVAMSAISYGSGRGHRSNEIARLLVQKRRNGANIAVIYTRPVGKNPPRAVRILRDGGIRVYAFDSRGCYLHNKFMTTTYPSRNGRQYRVWTGSEEWKESSYQQDEFVLKLKGKGTVEKYEARWRRLRDLSADDNERSCDSRVS